jgi:ribosomal RNA-processing protein 7
MAKKGKTKHAVQEASEPCYDNNGKRSIALVMDTNRTKVVGMPEGANRYIYIERKVADPTSMIQDEDEEDKTGRTLIVTAIPIYYSEQDIQEVFEMFGDVELVFFRVNHSVNGRTAEVIFEDDESVVKAFSTPDAKSYVTGSIQCGLEKFKTEYLNLRPDYSTLQTQVDMFMSGFDERTEREKEETKRRKNEVDEEGFRYVYDEPKKRGRDAVKDAVRRYNKRINQKVNTVFSFYKFQEQEKQIDKQMALRKKFEEDKQRVADMKSSRRFKPF